MATRRGVTAVLTATIFALMAAPALACGGLVAPNGGINLVRTTTLAAYYEGIEHYITSFEFNGEGGGEFGSIVPLPGIPDDVVKGGRWTLERLRLETEPPVLRGLALADTAEFASTAKVLLKT